ncbi:MAG: anhydro-N-acetylmuramic acid kinase [Bacteroidetes bacterium]|nr:anhydro-N-acetylmuramic acid kinase [Bacteroidota bacterium]
MVYRAIGIMSGSSLDGLDIVFTELHENAGKWSYEILNEDCSPYANEWTNKLSSAVSLSALEYQLLHTEYGHYIGREVNRFIEENHLHYKVALIASHGHTTFHIPAKKMTAQLGDGAAIAAETRLPVVTDLRALDVALGGQGAPIVPIGEKLLLGDYDYFLNIGGIANISSGKTDQHIAFDICPANRVLNMLANETGKEFDDGGQMASGGSVDEKLLNELNGLSYYGKPYPKSLANDFGTDTVYPLMKKAGIAIPDALSTYTEHIALQIKNAITAISNHSQLTAHGSRLLITGGGAFNSFLIERITDQLKSINVSVIIPDEKLVKYKEALIMALIGVLRWREEYNVFSSVTGAVRDSIGGALWNGQEA